MRHFLSILIVSLVIASGATAFAKDSTQPKQPAPASSSVAQNGHENFSSTDLEFAPDGLARDVMNLMTGIRRPLDKDTSVTIQAGTSLRLGLSF